MDFDKLPSDIFVKILESLPLEDQIRIERVNKRFKQFSSTVVSKSKSISLTHDPFWRLDVDSLSKLLQSCFANLKEIKISGNRLLVNILAQFTFPNLIEIAVSTNDVNQFFGSILTNNPNLIKVQWWDESQRCLIFPNVVCEKLRTLQIYRANATTFQSMTGRCPNLTYLKIYSIESGVSGEIIDAFFVSCPNLENFHTFKNHIDNFCYWQLNYFWQLNSMRSLTLCQKYQSIPFNDQDLRKISTSFLRLEYVCLNLYKINITNNGIAFLPRLINLKSVHIKVAYGIKVNLNSGIWCLLQCEYLQVLNIDVNITSTTLLALIKHSLELRHLEIQGVSDVKTIQEAATVVQSFEGFINRNILISIDSREDIWMSDTIQMALKKLTAGGHVIKIKYPKKNLPTEEENFFNLLQYFSDPNFLCS